MKDRTISESRQLMQYISDAIGTIRDPQELFRTVTDKLRLIFSFDSAVIVTVDRERRYLSLFFEMLRFSLPDHISRQKRLIAGSWFEHRLDERVVTTLNIEKEIPGPGDPDMPVCTLTVTYPSPTGAACTPGGATLGRRDPRVNATRR